MGMGTKIEWTSYRKPDGTVVPGATFNPWRGCTKVSAGCTNCYAETMSGRNPGTLGVWGRHGTRVIAAESYWRQPLKWNRDAEAAGERRRVFCASLADVFEGPAAMPASEWPKVEAARARLFEVIDATPYLDWLLLTKRPENIQRLWPFGWYDEQFTWPNVWIGTSVENQEQADKRIPELLKVPASVRFLSCEPLLGPIDLRFFDSWLSDDCYELYERLHWVIVGGESGSHARPMNPDWVRSLRDQCQAGGVPFFFKQWGEYVVSSNLPDSAPFIPSLITWPWTTGRGPNGLEGDTTAMVRVGKKAAGRLLDGREWSEVPR